MTLMDLPDELLRSVFSMTDVYTTRNLETTCLRFRAIASDNEVWKRFSDQLGIIMAYDTRLDKAIKHAVKPVYLDSLERVKQTFPKQLHDHCLEHLNLLPIYSFDDEDNDDEDKMLDRFPVVLSLESKSISIMYKNEEPKRKQRYFFGMAGKVAVFTALLMPYIDSTFVWLSEHKIKPITDDDATALADEIKKRALF